MDLPWPTNNGVRLWQTLVVTRSALVSNLVQQETHAILELLWTQYVHALLCEEFSVALLMCV